MTRLLVNLSFLLVVVVELAVLELFSEVKLFRLEKKKEKKKINNNNKYKV